MYHESATPTFFKYEESSTWINEERGSARRDEARFDDLRGRLRRHSAVIDTARHHEIIVDLFETKDLPETASLVDTSQRSNTPVNRANARDELCTPLGKTRVQSEAIRGKYSGNASDIILKQARRWTCAYRELFGDDIFRPSKLTDVDTRSSSRDNARFPYLRIVSADADERTSFAIKRSRE